MDPLTRPQLFELFDPRQHAGLEAALASDTVHGLAVYEAEDGKRRAIGAATTDAPATDENLGRLIGVFIKPGERVRRALAYLQENPRTTVRAAAHRHGVTAQAIYNVLNRQLKRQKNASKPPLCPCCGQPVVEPNGPRRGQRSS